MTLSQIRNVLKLLSSCQEGSIPWLRLRVHWRMVSLFMH